MKIPFDIKYKPQIESGEYKVITAKGQPVRIICWDRSTTYWKIIALVLAPDGKTENPFTYDVDGNESDGCLHHHEHDLFIVTPEPELTEWQRFISACLQKHGLLDCGAADRIAKNCSTELLDLARKELENDAPSIIHAQSFNAGLKHGKAEALNDLQENLANNDIYNVPEWLREVLLMAKENGKKEALKDLPRWKKFAPNINDPLSEQQICAELKNSVMRVDDGGYCWIISREELNKLPKEGESRE